MKQSAPTLYPNAQVSEKVTIYSESHSLALPKHLTDYHVEIEATRKDAFYMISTFESQALIWLGRLVGAKRVLEIGVHVGYSGLVWAQAVGKDGKVVGLEVSQEYADLAHAAFDKYGVKNAEVVVGDALKTLSEHVPDEPYDIIFIDANKSGYPAYLAEILRRSQPDADPSKRLLRAGGLIIADNVLRQGMPADDSEANPFRNPDRSDPATYFNDADIAGLREYNATVRSGAGGRLEGWIMPLWDGVSLTRLTN
jgi:predicted O-methyltransferase YrrM